MQIIMKTPRTVAGLLAAAMFLVLGAAGVATAAPIVAGDDYLVDSSGRMTITIFGPGGFTEVVKLTQPPGAATIHRDAQVGTTIDTEIVSLDLVGTSVHVGPIATRVGAANGVVEGPSVGVVINVVQDEDDPGYPFGDPSSFESGLSSFDVLFEIDFAGGTLYNKIPHTLGPLLITELPPLRYDYFCPLAFPLFMDIGVLGDHSDDGEAVGEASALHHTPEPATLGLLALGGMGALRRRRKSKA
jgi:hypothetical protein